MLQRTCVIMSTSGWQIGKEDHGEAAALHDEPQVENDERQPLLTATTGRASGGLRHTGVRNTSRVTLNEDITVINGGSTYKATPVCHLHYMYLNFFYPAGSYVIWPKDFQGLLRCQGC